VEEETSRETTTGKLSSRERVRGYPEDVLVTDDIIPNPLQWFNHSFSHQDTIKLSKSNFRSTTLSHYLWNKTEAVSVKLSEPLIQQLAASAAVSDKLSEPLIQQLAAAASAAVSDKLSEP